RISLGYGLGYPRRAARHTYRSEMHGAADIGYSSYRVCGRLAQRESASFTPKRPLVRSQYRPPSSEAIFHRRRWALSWPYSNEVQQRSAVKALAQLLERRPRGLGRNLCVDLRRDRELGVTQDLHGDSRVHVEIGQQ